MPLTKERALAGSERALLWPALRRLRLRSKSRPYAAHHLVEAAAAPLLLAAVAAVLTWRTLLSAQALHEAGEVTTLVSLPVWMPTLALTPGLALMTVCALYRAWASFQRDKTLPGRG